MGQEEKNPRSNLSGLEALADFLNFNHDSGDAEVFKDLQQKYSLPPLILSASLWDWNVEDSKAANKAKKLHSELKRDLEPIIPPAKADNPTEAYDRIEKLLKKINNMKFQTGWAVDSVEYTMMQLGDPQAEKYELVRKEPEELLKTSELLLSPHRVIEVLGYKWFFGRKPQGISMGLSRENLYLIILDALESGEFSRLKRCQWTECQKFFVAEPQGKKFCSIEHTLEADKKEAARRVKEQRREKREAKQRKSWPTPQSKAFELFLNFMKQARKGKVDKDELTKRKPIADALEQWQKGASLNVIWKELPDEARKVSSEFGRNAKVARRPRKARGV